MGRVSAVRNSASFCHGAFLSLQALLLSRPLPCAYRKLFLPPGSAGVRRLRLLQREFLHRATRGLCERRATPVFAHPPRSQIRAKARTTPKPPQSLRRGAPFVHRDPRKAPPLLPLKTGQGVKPLAPVQGRAAPGRRRHPANFPSTLCSPPQRGHLRFNNHQRPEVVPPAGLRRSPPPPPAKKEKPPPRDARTL